MFRNYLVIALRNLIRHKLYSFINIAGLTVGLACVIFIILFIRDETSYDKWIPGSENLYRVEETITLPGQAPMQIAGSAYPVAVAMQQQLPEVAGMTHLTGNRLSVMIGSQIYSDPVYVADPSFFQVIKLPLVEGFASGVFSQPNSIVLSQTLARKYFGEADPFGKTLILSEKRCDDGGDNCRDDQYAMKVTGVMRDLPHNSHLSFEALIPTTSNADPLPQREKQAWFNNHGFAYVQLVPGADPKAVVAKMEPIIDRSADPKLMANFNGPGSALLHINLTPFRELHLSTDRYRAMKAPGSWTTIYGFAAIGILIQLVACFNFTNLATARATLRAREVSLRKVMGATRCQLIVQFVGESMLMSVLALLLALAIVEILQPGFDEFLTVPITFHYLADWPVLLGAVGVALASGVLGGIYPAFVLSNYRPAAILRANQTGQGASGILRTALVVLQFAVSIGLGIAALVIFLQISFARNLDLGFNKDNIVVVNAGSLTQQARKSFADALSAIPGIAGVTSSMYVPFDGNDSNWDVHVPGSATNQVMRTVGFDPDFPRLYGVHLLAGRYLDKDRPTDATSGPLSPTYSGNSFNVMINEAALKQLHLTLQNAVNSHLLLHNIDVTVVGVLADFKWGGTTEPVVPTIFANDPTSNTALSVRLRGGQTAESLANIDRTWQRFAPTFAISRRFLSDSFDRQFRGDDRQGMIFGLFVGIAISIACLGLFGLAAFTAGRRTKEIGIRKIFGARSFDIIFLLLWQFSIPVLIANAIAWPLAWYYLHGWLEGYAYRISLNPLYFFAVGTAALAIAWVTIFAHARRVALTNPIHALRYE